MHRRGRPVEHDGVGGLGASGGGHHHRDRLGGLRRQRHRRGGRAARGRHAVYRHRRARVGSGGGHRHPGHIQRRRTPVLESRHIIVPGISQVGGGGHLGAVGFHHRGQLDGDSVVVLVGHRRRRTQCRIIGQGRRLGCHLLADSPGVLCPHLDLVSHLTGETGDGVGGPRHDLHGISGLPGGAVVVGLLPPTHPVPRAGGVGASEFWGRPCQCHGVDGWGRRQVAHRRRRPTERDGVGGGLGASGGGHYHRDRLGGLRR